MTPAGLDRRYRSAEYCVQLASGDACFRIGRYSRDTECALREDLGNFARWAIVTPFNPRSVALCEQENLARLEDFRRELLRLGWRHLPSVNRDPHRQWPDEAGALIADQPLSETERLGRRWEQNAIVAAEAGSAPALVWL